MADFCNLKGLPVYLKYKIKIVQKNIYPKDICSFTPREQALRIIVHDGCFRLNWAKFVKDGEG